MWWNCILIRQCGQAVVQIEVIDPTMKQSPSTQVWLRQATIYDHLTTVWCNVEQACKQKVQLCPHIFGNLLQNNTNSMFTSMDFSSAPMIGDEDRHHCCESIEDVDFTRVRIFEFVFI